MRKGFTLIELLAVVMIVGVLSAVALPYYRKAVEHSRAAEPISVMNYIEQMARVELIGKTLPYPEDKSICDEWYRSMGLRNVGNNNWKSDHFIYFNANCMQTLISTHIARNDTATTFPPSNYQDSLYDLYLDVQKDGFRVRSRRTCSGGKLPEACNWFNE